MSHDLDAAGEDASIVEDEYISGFARSSYERAGWNRKSTGEALPSSDEGEADDDGEAEDDDMQPQWGSVRGQQPTLIQNHSANRMKSREGFLRSFDEDDEVETSPTEGSPHLVQRATSINLGKGHVRNFSAGSAKLLDITPRASVDAKRRSLSPRP
jgi:hypothetical protein